MVDTPGRCRELDYCSVGQMRTLVRIPMGRPFVCPECGKPLRAPAPARPGLSKGRIAMIGGGAVAGAAALTFLLWPSPAKHQPRLMLTPQGMVVLAPRPAPPALVAAAPDPRAPALPLAAFAIATPVPANIEASPQAAPPLVTTPPSTTPPATTPPSTTPLSTTLTGTQLPGAAPPVPSPLAPAAVVPPKGKPPPSRIRMECSMDAAGVPSNCTPASVEVPAAPAVAAAQPRPSPKVPVKPAVPPAERPAPPPDRVFSSVPVAGGTPAYPADYVRDGRAGAVTLSCHIEPTGEPTHCKVRDTLGGRRFAEATVNWLNTGEVRFAPAMRHGRPMASDEEWQIAFHAR